MLTFATARWWSTTGFTGVLASGPALGALAFGTFSAMDVLVKSLSAAFPPHQIVFCNAVVTLVLILLWTVRNGGPLVLRTNRLRLQLIRGLFGMTSAVCGFNALARLPLTDAYAIIFTAPLLITALSVPLLGERVGWRRGSAVAAGFLGVLIMLRPGAEPVQLGTLFACAAALAIAISSILMRRLTHTETTPSIAFYSNLVVCVGTGLMLLLDAAMPDPSQLLLLIATGVLGAVGLMILISAYKIAEAAVVAPFQYTQMVWGALFGYLLFADLPSLWVIGGASIVTASGLYILRRETYLRRLRLQAGAAAPPPAGGS